MGNQNCSDCDRLWRAYARATSRHIDLVNQQRQAYMDHEFDHASELDETITEVGEERQAAGSAIYEHEAKVHGRFAPAEKAPTRSASG